jgi:hypothetical protein
LSIYISEKYSQKKIKITRKMDFTKIGPLLNSESFSDEMNAFIDLLVIAVNWMRREEETTEEMSQY